MRYFKVDFIAAVEDNEVVCNIKKAKPEVIAEIASESVRIFHKNHRQIQAVINEQKYEALCKKHGLKSIKKYVNKN